MAQPARPPIRFGSFRLMRDAPLGSGAYGQVCGATLDELPCTAKLLHAILLDPDRPRNRRLFEQLCRFLSEIRHQNNYNAVSGRGGGRRVGPAHSADGAIGRLPHSFSGAIGGAAGLPRAGQHRPRYNSRHCLPALKSHRPPRPLKQQRVTDRCGQQSKSDGFRDEHADRTESSHDRPNQVPGQPSVHVS